ncbi:ribonucleotide-diphosphate reductase subunit beta [Crossiella cryophila]|uniref:Ribonucleotide reductase beta subunit family protein with ferritin-like domain n=1 Tax=Crossiella cryophila TaxID=43355 RepID=A0A7W7C7S4_9PSEU|nr:ribonucleotide-diphosphate reductase subunit beta [Crossiella cryophila]MBB4676105.1 ribonucleotide reductase beta subunit family protein with ferritin-like domain [Crossiella cryophila]
MDEAKLGELPSLPADAVLRHADLVIGRKPKPIELYQRWERQQWSAEDLSLGKDHDMLNHPLLPENVRVMLKEAIATFIIGEYTGLDMLGPILMGCPDEEYALFLGTQIADETRHARAVFRLGEEVLEMSENPRAMLAEAWQIATPAHRELSMLETSIVRDLTNSPPDYGRWLQACTLFHLITEGVLALIGQRALVHSLRDTRMFDGIKAAFTAMCRDESRHISFGLHALRTGVQEGYGDYIYEALEQAVPLALRMDEEFESGDSREQDKIRQMSVDILRRHLGNIGADPKFVAHLTNPYDLSLARQ